MILPELSNSVKIVQMISGSSSIVTGETKSFFSFAKSVSRILFGLFDFE